MADAEERPDFEVPGRFESFYHQEYAQVVALLYGLTGNRWTAEDLAQEAFLRAHRDWAKVRELQSARLWLRRVAINLAMSTFRRIRSEATARLRMVPFPETLEGPSADQQSFWAEVRKLPRRQAQAIALYYIDELFVAEIGDVLEVAEGTVKALLHQGRTRLARQLAAKGWIDHEPG